MGRVVMRVVGGAGLVLLVLLVLSKSTMLLTAQQLERSGAAAATEGAGTLEVEIRYSGGGVVGRTTNRAVQFKGATAMLGDFSRIDLRPNVRVTFADGRQVNGDVMGLGEVEVSLGDVTVRPDLLKATSITIRSAGQRAAAGAAGTAPGAEVKKSMAVVTPVKPAGNGAPVVAAAPVAADVDGVVTVRLPAPAEDVTPAGGGSYLLLWMRKLQKVGVFDVENARMAGYIPAPSDSIAMTGGSEKVLLALNDHMLLQRWDLKTLEKEQTAPVDQPVKTLVMGWASSGPAVLNGRIVYNVETLKPISVQDKANGYRGIDGEHQIRASGDGTTVAAWRTNSSPSGMYVGQLSRTTLEWKYEHNSTGPLMPSYDGSVIFTGYGGVYTSELKPVPGESFRQQRCIPAYHANYFLTVRPGDAYGAQGANGKTVVSLYTTSDRRLLMTLPQMAEMQPVPNTPTIHSNNAMPLDKRYHFIPALNSLVTFPETNDQLVVRRFSVTEALERTGIDYLFVDSLPRRMVRPGQTYEYQIIVRSKRGNVRFKLDSGPAGMTITRDGLIRWAVPKGLIEKQVGVIVTVGDGSGQEIPHAFNVALDLGLGAAANRAGQSIVITPHGR